MSHKQQIRVQKNGFKHLSSYFFLKFVHRLHIVEMLPKIIHGQIFSNLLLDQSITVRHQEWAMASASAGYLKKNTNQKRVFKDC